MTDKLKQYFRYCVHCFEADDFRCSDHPDGAEPHWTREQINRPNNCPNFALSELGDVETGKMYRPRRDGAGRADFEQMRMEIEI